ncbi:Transcription elongation factor spt6 [Irineochytrium annulatum]|nr:Transcription elongation factor spt6 [Irineochytrium annulatum]
MDQFEDDDETRENQLVADQGDGEDEGPTRQASVNEEDDVAVSRKKKKKIGSRFAIVDDEAAEDDDEEEEEEGGKKKRKKKISDDEEDSSEEDSDDEETEADKQFVVDDDEEGEGVEEDDEGAPADEGASSKKHRRKHKKRRRREEDLEEDDLELIGETTQRRRLRRKGEEPDRRRKGADLTTMFDAEDDLVDVQEEFQKRPSRQADFDERELDSEEEMEDFIDYEDDEEEDEDSKAERKRAKAQTRKHFERDYGISDANVKRIALGTKTTSKQRPGGKRRNLQRQGFTFLQALNACIQLYEPSQVKEQMMTEEDKVIQMKNMPERFQLRGEHLVIEEEELRTEANFIARRMRDSGTDREALTPVIFEVLKMFHFDKMFEVPFIIAHRKDYFNETLDRADLWRIYDLDIQYFAIEAKKKAVRGLLEDVRSLSAAASADTLPDEILHSNARSLEDLQDVIGYMQLHYSVEIQRAEESRRRELKRAHRKTPYEEARKAGVHEFVKLFGVDVKKFSEGMTGSKVSTHVIEDTPRHPLDAAEEFVRSDHPYFKTAERILDAGCSMLAQEVAADPMFRQFVRKVYETDAVVTVTPTDKGKREIQPLHPFYPFKYLTEKPVYKFNDGQFLQLMTAEEQGLVEVSLRVEEEARLIEDVVKNLTNDYSNEFAESWNAQRRRVAEQAAKKFLFPQVCKWLKEKLAAEASDWVAEQCRYMLEQKIDIAPYRRTRAEDEEEDDEQRDYARVMALSWGDGSRDTGTHVVLIDEQGLVAERLRLTKMQHRDGKVDDHEKLLDFIKEHTPDVIVVGGWTAETKLRLLPDIATLISRISEHGDDEDSRGRRRYRAFFRPELIMVDDEVARLAMASKRFAKEFPDTFHPVARYCVSLARRVQDPTHEYATLFNSDEEMKLLRVHPLQGLLREDKLKAAFERAFINVVNFNGVDINEAANPLLKHRSYTLQFVSGLGPRKAQHLISRIAKLVQRYNVEGGKLPSRLSLIGGGVSKRFGIIMTSTIFMNCASFLRVRAKHISQNHDVLDDTRIHPEDYDLARKMAADALEIDDVDEEDVKQGDPSPYVRKLMEEQPESLNLLMLDDYAKELERVNHEPKRITLNEIKAELMSPYRDRRRRFTPATNGEVFTMLTSETLNDTLRPGVVVSCRIAKVLDRFIKVTLNCGIDGTIQLHRLPSDKGIHEFIEGEYVQAAVVSVDPSRFIADVDARDEVVGKNWMRNISKSTRDEFFRDDREKDDDDRSRDLSSTESFNIPTSKTSRFRKQFKS